MRCIAWRRSTHAHSARTWFALDDGPRATGLRCGKAGRLMTSACGWPQVTVSGEGRVLKTRAGDGSPHDRRGRGGGRGSRQGGTGLLSNLVMVEPTSPRERPVVRARSSYAAAGGSQGGEGEVLAKSNKPVSEKRLQGQLRREARRATIQGMMESSVTTIPGKDKVPSPSLPSLVCPISSPPRSFVPSAAACKSRRPRHLRRHACTCLRARAGSVRARRRQSMGQDAAHTRPSRAARHAGNQVQQNDGLQEDVRRADGARRQPYDGGVAPQRSPCSRFSCCYVCCDSYAPAFMLLLMLLYLCCRCFPHPTPYPYTPHSTPYTTRPTPYTLHPKR